MVMKIYLFIFINIVFPPLFFGGRGGGGGGGGLGKLYNDCNSR